MFHSQERSLIKEKIRVLLVEDDADDYVLTRSLLSETKGFEVNLDWASNYEEGLRKARHGDHHVILVDYRLGQHSGMDFLQAAKNRCTAPIIFLTGQENYEVDVAATRAGASDYLVKTDLTAASLERAIRYSMEHERVESAWRNALQENSRLATAITNLPIGVIITDAQQNDNPIVFVNPAFTEITGYSVMEVTGRNCRFLQGTQTNRETVDQMREVIDIGRPFQGQILNYRKNGTSFWNDLRLQPLFDGSRVVNYVGLMHDVTSHVQAEQSNRDLLASLSERVKEMTSLHSAARILQDEEISNEILLQQLVEQIPPAFQIPEHITARLMVGQQEYSTDAFRTSEYSLASEATLSDGREVRLEVFYNSDEAVIPTPFIEEERSLLQSVVEMLCSRWERDLAREALQDAHAQLEERVARRTLELETRTRELHDSENRLRKINQEILVLSRLKFPPQATVREVLGVFNEAAVRSMDIERSSAWMFNEARDTMTCLDFFDKSLQAHGGGAEAQVSELPAAFDTLEAERTLAVTDAATDPRIPDFYRKFLQPLNIASLLLAPILKDGIVTGILSLARMDSPLPWTLEDQTYAGSLADLIALQIETLELQKTEESLRVATLEAEAARRSAEDANNAKSEFLSRMSHELRTPLNSILGFSQLLQRDQLDEKHQQRVGLIVTAGRHLLSLINEVLDIARVESGQMALSIEPVQVRSMIEETLSLVMPLASRHNISFVNETTQALPADAFALADKQKLHQVLLNLLSNAIKYNEDGGHVRVSCEVALNNRLRISVTNSGRGIEPENLERAFIPFERLDADQSGTEGTGLGLALAKRLTEAMGGTIEARSTPGQETTFTITLPMAKDPSQAPRAVLDKVAQALPQEQFCVLYIEDNLTNLKLIESIFSEIKNVQLITTMQGRMGLEMAREHLPDLILLDLHLPDISGEEVLMSLKQEERTRSVPVIIVSADAITSHQKRLLDLGAVHYLTKPLDIERFLTVVNETLRAAKSQQ